MSFYNVVKLYDKFKYHEYFQQVNPDEILRIIKKEKKSEQDFLTLLSPQAENFMEEMAVEARKKSLQHFGKAVLLYTPMYLANYCVNKCAYCSFNLENNITRRKLTMNEIDLEAQVIAATGLKHIVVLTGESQKHTPISYIIDAVKILKKYFDSISIEIYPLTESQYSEVIKAGVDGLTIYQEVYDFKIYEQVHLSGPKKNYLFRLNAAERACREKIRSVNIGVLLGLNDWRIESFMTGLHAKYLQDKYPDVDIAVSLPRIRPHVGVFEDVKQVSDRNLVQIMLALRLFKPNIGINISTREKEELRDNLIPLGVTKMSAGVSTEVGGHTTENHDTSQFEISDKRSVDQIRKAILSKGYHPVFKDWMQI